MQSEESMVKGYRGTPTWTAPEVGTPHGLIKTYSTIRADQWSCGKMLHYFTKFCPTGSTLFNEVRDQLLCSVASRRPPLSEILEMVQAGSSARGVVRCRKSDSPDTGYAKRACIT